MNNQATLSIESPYNPSTAERTTEHGRLFGCLAVWLFGCLLTPHASRLFPAVPGCLFFPVLWASEPARSDDETTYFFTQRNTGDRPRVFSIMMIILSVTERVTIRVTLQSDRNGMHAKTNEVMTIDELAAYVKISKSTLYKLVQNGEVPGQKIGNHWRFRREAIDRWLDAESVDAQRQTNR